MASCRTFYDVYSEIRNKVLPETCPDPDDDGALRAMMSEEITAEGLKKLLCSSSERVIEEAALRAYEGTVRNFGKVVHLYTPLYLSSFCDNECAYCGFKSGNNVKRRTLTVDEVKREAEYIYSKGLRNVLILTGGSRKEAPLEYIKSCVRELRKKFTSVSIEIYELTSQEYRELVDEGVDGLVLYQEVYDKEIYDRVHISGAKKNYRFRLEAPERALSAGMRTVNIGPLLGLGQWRKEIFFTAMHAAFLEKRFPWAEISVSVPRIRPQISDFEAVSKVSDKDLVQIVTSLRLFLPRVGITLSTRERSSLRDMLITVGVTRMSAGSTTRVGGHTMTDDPVPLEQFEILDGRSVEEIKQMLRTRGYQPVLKDWV